MSYQDTSDGTSTYYGDSGDGFNSAPNYPPDVGASGVANASSPLTLPPDASGGNGSFLTELLPTLTNGTSAVINSALLSSLGQNSSLYTVDAYGNLVPKAAAGANNAAYRATVAPLQPSVLTSSKTLYAVGAVILLLVVLAAAKK